jgi:lysophospholipase L1-like esterase
MKKESILLFLISFILINSLDTTNNKYSKWVAMWGNAMSIVENMPETYSKNITLRYPIYCPFSGNYLRLRFDNFCGTEPIIINKITISKSQEEENAIENSFITVNIPKEGLKILPKQNIMTEAIPFQVEEGKKILISFYLKDFTLMRSSVAITGPLSVGYYGLGDMTEIAYPDINLTKKTSWFYFLSDIDIYTNKKNNAIICYGDSITSQDWPDYLMLELKKNNVNNLSIIRKAASGTRILKEYSCITYESYGLCGKNRIPRELNVTGAKYIIIQQGINDIIHPVGLDVNKFRPMEDLPTIPQLIEGMEYYIKECNKKGLEVFLGTLLPIYGWRTYEDFREEIKNGFNDWMRSKVDNNHVIDFHKALEDENDFRKFKNGYDSGDHLHPSSSAYKRMAEEAFKVIMRNL